MRSERASEATTAYRIALHLQRRFAYRRFANYFKSVWNYIDLANLVLFIVSASYWAEFVRHLSIYSPQKRWGVLENLNGEANFMKLNNEDAREYITFLEDTQELVDLRSKQSIINGVALLLLVLRLLKNLDFQPRLGLVTRTLSHAATNLGHFIMVFGLVFFSYSTMGHLGEWERGAKRQQRQRTIYI